MMDNNEKILIVEDDSVISGAIVNHLNSWGYSALCAADFKNVLNTFESFGPQLVLLDISLPFYNGFHWCREIRKISTVPIVFLSSASDNMNIVMAMNMGADDFISKPFDLAVLTAKIQAILRRAGISQDKGVIVKNGEVLLNISELTVSRGNEKAELTKNESRIMEVLMTNAGRCAQRDDIISYLWENDSFVDDNTLTVNITRIRKKLEGIGLCDYIVTKKGLGYMIAKAE